jgi:hypothetical protein
MLVAVSAFCGYGLHFASGAVMVRELILQIALVHVVCNRGNFTSSVSS